MVVCRQDDKYSLECCQPFNDEETALCTKIERDFLAGLMGGCSTPISALAEVINGEVLFKGQVIDPNDLRLGFIETNGQDTIARASDMGTRSAQHLLAEGHCKTTIERICNKGLTTDGEA